MGRPGSVALLAATLCSAQTLVTNDDGSVLYITTTLRQKDSGQSAYGKVFVFDAGGLRLLEARDRVVISAPGADPFRTNYYALVNADVSGDGRTLALSAYGECASRNRCFEVPREMTTLTAPAGVREIPGVLRLSQNGQWALQPNSTTFAGTRALWNLATGNRVTINEFLRVSPAGRSVANDGTVVGSGWEILLWCGGRATQLTNLLTEQVSEPVIDAAGTTVVFPSRWQSPYDSYSRLRVVDLVTGTIRTLIEGYTQFWQPVLTNDGKQALFLSTPPFDLSAEPTTPQVFLIGIDGRSLRQITHDFEGVSSAILSGDGRVVYYITRSGRLVRLSVDTGDRATLFWFPATILGLEGFAPGSLATIPVWSRAPGAAERSVGSDCVVVPARGGDSGPRRYALAGAHGTSHRRA